jgi:hypothetical protein
MMTMRSSSRRSRIFSSNNNHADRPLLLTTTSSLGDIMSTTNATTYHSPTTTTTSTGDRGPPSSPPSSSSSSLRQQYQIGHPLDRMVLTANGNLQRLISSYYDTEVTVRIQYCTVRDPPPTIPNDNHPSSSSSSNNSSSSSNCNTTTTTATTATAPQIWDRQVQLCIYQHHVVCTAHSTITVYDRICQDLIASHTVGIGQLFRYLNILPHFTLHDAGLLVSSSINTTIGHYHHNNNNNNNCSYDLPTTNSSHAGDGGGGGGFWREYTLSCTQLTCHIREEFPIGLWNITEPTISI